MGTETTDPTDPRIEAIIASPNDMTHLWIIGEKRCICGATGSYDGLKRHIAVVQAERILAVADAVDPARVSLTQAQADAPTWEWSPNPFDVMAARALEEFAAELDETAMSERHDDHCSLTEAAELARLRAASLLAQPETTHLIHAGDGRMACCGRTAFELPRDHRVTLDVTAANCPALAQPEPAEEGNR